MSGGPPHAHLSNQPSLSFPLAPLKGARPLSTEFWLSPHHSGAHGEALSHFLGLGPGAINPPRRALIWAGAINPPRRAK